ncbi:MAG: hypothetical protein Q4A74_06600 [Cardiobacteriaceae bacterium]|nr:hypothetical protein [Cardiobacteriaceae bacterium]
MHSYQDTISALQAALENHSPAALERFARKVISALEQQMKEEEIAQELTIEQPHYRRLRQLIREQDWNEKRIGAELDMLDQVVAVLGDDYPAETAHNNLSFTTALDYWRNLQTTPDAATAAIIAGFYLDNIDHEAFANDKAPDEKHWAEHPTIAAAIQKLRHWINIQ